jgi:hypothetical protein
MPAGAHVTVTAVFVPAGSNRINTKVTPQFRGTITLNPDITMAAQGQQITVTAATAGNVGNIYSPTVKVEGASGNNITGAVLTGTGPWTLTMPNEEITVTAVFVQDVATLESQNVLHGNNNSGFRNDASSSAFSVMHNQEYEFEIQYKTAGTAGRPVVITVIPGNENWPAGNSGFSSVLPYNGSHGRGETFLGTTMVILDNTGGEWVTERFTFKATGDFISKGSWGDGSTAGVYVGINPENTAGAEGWVNYVCLRRMTGDAPPSVNVLGNSRFKNGLTNWSHYNSGTNAGLVTINAPRVPAYAIKD